MIRKVVFATICLASSLAATTITFGSNGSVVDPNESNSLGITLAISPHTAWANAFPGTDWVSNGSTGSHADPGFFAPPNGTTVSFYDSVFVPFVPTAAHLRVGADDSTSVIINGMLVMAEAQIAGNPYTTCSNVAIGCLASTEVTLNIVSYLQPGVNTFQFDVAQRNGDGFGLNYRGEISGPGGDVVTPEPASVALSGMGLVVLALTRRRRK